MTKNLCFAKLKINGLVTRIDSIDGVDYLVAPVVAIVEGVLNGERVPAEAIQESVLSWNGVPVVINHPRRNGEHVSANLPELADEIVGRLYNVTFDGSALKGEVWLDIAKCKRLGGEALQALKKIESSVPVEVSTGYFASSDETHGEYKGEPYSAVQTAIKPDHLALLPNGIGACDWTDGCGVPRMNIMNKRSTARTPKYSGTETVSWADVTKSFEAYRDGYYKNTGTSKPDEVPSSVSAAPSAMKTWIASKTLLGEASASTVSDLISFPVVNPSTNKLNAGALRAAISRAPQASISGEAKNSIQRVARRLLAREFGDGERANEEPTIMTNILKTFKSLFGISKNDSDNRDDSVIVNCFTSENTTIEDPDRLIRNGRNLSALLSKIVKDQISSERPKRDILKQMADVAGIDKDKMDEIMNGTISFIPFRWLHAFASVLDIDAWELLNAANIDGMEFIRESLPAFKERFNSEENSEIIETIINNESNGFTGEDKEFLKTLPLDTLKKFSACPCSNADKEVEVAEESNKANEEVEPEIKAEESVSDTIEETPVEMEAAAPETAQTEETIETQSEEVVPEETEAAPPTEEVVEEFAPATVDDLLSKATPEIKQKVLSALQTYDKVRESLSSEIVSNSEFTLDDLREFSVEKLEKLASSLRKKTVVNAPQDVDYGGRAIPRQRQTDNGAIPPPPPVVLAKR